MPELFEIVKNDEGLSEIAFKPGLPAPSAHRDANTIKINSSRVFTLLQ